MKKKNLKIECHYIADNLYYQLQMAKYTTQFKIQVCYHFFHWLRKEHLLLEYIENYEKHRFENIIHIASFISSAFKWVYTKQGYNFWANASNKWYDYVVNHNDLLIKMYGIKKLENEKRCYNTTRH